MHGRYQPAHVRQQAPDTNESTAVQRGLWMPALACPLCLRRTDPWCLRAEGYMQDSFCRLIGRGFCPGLSTTPLRHVQ